MSLTNLLAVVATEEAIDIVNYIAIGAIALLAVITLVICLAFRKRKMDTKAIAYAAVCLAASFVLSFIKVSPVPNGGSITLASWVPVLIYAYAYGAPRGFLVGIIFGILNFISGPYILTPFSFVLDYILAFTMVGLMGFARKFGRSLTFNVVLGTVIVALARLVMHFFSGVIYFQNDAVWVEFPEWAVANAYIYSLIYQLIYIPADAVINIVVLAVLAKTGTLQTLLHMVRPALFPNKAAAQPADAAPTQEAASDANAKTSFPQKK